MREAVFILFVAFLLLGLTAIRYRKQIAALLELARVLKGGALPPSPSGHSIPGRDGVSIPLVNCSTCGIWVPETKAVKFGGHYICSKDCIKLSKIK